MCAGVEVKITPPTRLPGGPNPAWYLIDDAWAHSTKLSYNRGINAFNQWLVDTKQSAQWCNEQEMDHLLCEYAHYLHKNDLPISRIKEAASGVAAYLQPRRGAYRWTWKAIKGWSRNKPSKRHMPISWPLTVAVACEMARNGHYHMGIAALVSFNALLRISEVLQLTPANILMPGDLRKSHNEPLADDKYCHLWLVKTKTGTNQSAYIDDPRIIVYLKSVMRMTGHNDRIFPFTPAEMNKQLKKASINLGCGQPWTWHSFRHGGATLLYRRHQNVDIVMKRGRWAQGKTSRHYIQDCMVNWLSLQAPKAIMIIANHLANELDHSLADAAMLWAGPLTQ